MRGFRRAQFQEAAVQRIVARLRDRSGSRRMLLADEVGLGKTVVARGVIEDLMKGRRKPLTVIYLCSNAEIAEQNRRKLDPQSERSIGRVTQLAMRRQTEDLNLQLYSFTPGTSLKAGTGLEWERRLLMYLLHRAYGLPVWRQQYSEFFRCGDSYTEVSPSAEAFTSSPEGRCPQKESHSFLLRRDGRNDQECRKDQDCAPLVQHGNPLPSQCCVMNGV